MTETDFDQYIERHQEVKEAFEKYEKLLKPEDEELFQVCSVKNKNKVTAWDFVQPELQKVTKKIFVGLFEPEKSSSETEA